MSDKACRENYDALLQLPIVQKLTKKNKELKKRIKLLESIIYEFPVLFQRPKVNTETATEPTLCDTLADDDNEVLIISNPKKEESYIDLSKEDEEVLDHKPNIFIKIEKDEGLVQDEEEEVEETEEEEETEEVEEEVEEEEQEETEEVEEEDQEEIEEVEEEDEEVFEITIQGKQYYTNNENNGKIYSILPDEDVGPIVGNFKNGKPIFT